MNPIIHYSERRGSERSDSSMASDSSTPSSLPSLDHRTTSLSSRFPVATPSDSYSTYRSTCSSITDDDEAGSCSSDDDYEVDAHQRAPPRSNLSYNQATYTREPFEQRAVPATPSQFAQLFPSREPLFIKHDDSTPDGDMNIRVDARSSYGHRITLFHARIYDLRDRDVSIRRYGRDCGREVAHAKRRFEKVTKKQRPVLTKAFTSFRGKTFEQQRELRRIERQDSGYSTGMDDEEDEEEEITFNSNGKPAKATNSCNLEFSNYAHVDLTRKGTKQYKKYEFEYWGSSYAWKRTLPNSSDDDISPSYDLLNNTTGNTVARIRPDPDTQLISGFVRPCTMVFRDSPQDPILSARCDVYDVIVTTALMTLIDDTIKRRYNKKRVVQLTLPGAGRSLNMEYVGPRKFIDQMFGGVTSGAGNNGARRPLLVRSLSTSMGLKGYGMRGGRVGVPPK